MARSRRPGLVLASLLLLGLAAGIVALPGREPVQRALAASPTAVPAEGAALALAATTEAPEHAALVGDPTLVPGVHPSARGFLARYYGPRWPEIQAGIEASGLEGLDQPYEYRPWEEVEGAFRAALPMADVTRQGIVRAKLRWPDVLTTEYVANEYAPGRRSARLDAQALAELDLREAARNAEIAAVADFFAGAIDMTVQERWLTGRYLKGPFTTAGLGGAEGFHSQSHVGFGWALTVTLTWDECPELAALDQEIAALRDERDRDVLAFLEEWLAR